MSFVPEMLRVAVLPLYVRVATPLLPGCFWSVLSTYAGGRPPFAARTDRKPLDDQNRLGNPFSFGAEFREHL